MLDNKTLIVGIGGTGQKSLLKIKELMKKNYLSEESEDDFPLVEFLAIDTQFSNFSNYDASFKQSEMISTEINRKKMVDYLNNPGEIDADDFTDKQYIKHLASEMRENDTMGIGIIAKLALWENLKKVRRKVEEKIDKLKNQTSANQQLDSYNVFVICSLGGGTGKGMFLSLGAMINELLKNEGITNSLRCLVNYMPSCFTKLNESSYLQYIKANQYASFKELKDVLDNGYSLEKKMQAEFSVAKSDNIFTDLLLAQISSPNNSQEFSNVNFVVANTITNYILDSQGASKINLSELQVNPQTGIELTAINSSSEIFSLPEVSAMKDEYVKLINNADNSAQVKHNLHTNVDFINLS